MLAEQIYAGYKNFHEQVSDHEKRKICALQKFPAMQYFSIWSNLYRTVTCTYAWQKQNKVV